jgi:hypothetical protein
MFMHGAEKWGRAYSNIYLTLRGFTENESERSPALTLRHVHIFRMQSQKTCIQHLPWRPLTEDKCI